MKTLPKAQLDVMLTIWNIGKPFSRRELQELLKEKKWQTATINTILARLTEEGFLEHTLRGREFIYTAVISKDEYQSKISKDIVESLYNGSLASFVLNFVGGGKLSKKDVEELQDFLDDFRSKNDLF